MISFWIEIILTVLVIIALACLGVWLDILEERKKKKEQEISNDKLTPSTEIERYEIIKDRI